MIGSLVVLFGYACHATTLGGDFYRYNGDYAGYAQIALEQAHPGSTAMFLAGCGADINPSPRGTLELAEQHGKALGGAVERVLEEELQAVRGPLAVAFECVDLPFVDPPTKADLEQRRGEGNVYQQRLTEVLLQRLERQGTLEASYHLSNPCRKIRQRPLARRVGRRSRGGLCAAAETRICRPEDLGRRVL